MLSRGKITPGRARYYTQTVATGLDDYLSGQGEAPGRWEGTGAAREGLSGEVTPEHMARLFESADPCHPLNGSLLGRPYRVRDGVDKVVGWDLTLSAPLFRIRDKGGYAESALMPSGGRVTVLFLVKRLFRWCSSA